MFKFIKIRDDENDFDLTDVMHKTDANTLDDILREFALFLRGCGYSLPHCDYPIIVNEEDDE